MARIVTTRTMNVFTGTEAGAMTFVDVTVLLVRMTAAQVREWKWVGDMWNGTDPVTGYEVRDTTGTLLGVILPLGHMASCIHAEWYDPARDDFFFAGETNVSVLTQGIARVLEARRRNIGPVATGEGFHIEEPRLLPTRLSCWLRTCPEDCPECEADYQRHEAERLAWAAG